MQGKGRGEEKCRKESVSWIKGERATKMEGENEKDTSGDRKNGEGRKGERAGRKEE